MAEYTVDVPFPPARHPAMPDFVRYRLRTFPAELWSLGLFRPEHSGAEASGPVHTALMARRGDTCCGVHSQRRNPLRFRRLPLGSRCREKCCGHLEARQDRASEIAEAGSSQGEALVLRPAEHPRLSGDRSPPAGVSPALSPRTPSRYRSEPHAQPPIFLSAATSCVLCRQRTPLRHPLPRRSPMRILVETMKLVRSIGPREAVC
jgi:hypothetical protein